MYFLNKLLASKKLNNFLEYKLPKLLSNLKNSWMKSREAFDGPVSSKLKNNGTDLQKLLLGEVDKW